MEPITINHFNRRKEFIQMLAERGAKFGVEIGTDHGKYAEQLLVGIPGLSLYCIDPYVAYTEGNQVHTQEEMDELYKGAWEIIRKHNGHIFRNTSMEALQFFPAESLDFVFIDGNHDYEHVKEDISEWIKKVKPGGIVAGHDYKEDPINNYGVIQAVNEYVKENHIAPWFILHAGGSLVDCWLFIKQ